MTRYTEAVKDRLGGIRAVKSIEMDPGNMICHKVPALIQRVLNAGAPEHFGIILAGPQST